MPKEQLYKKYARLYDKIYSRKRYDKEVDFIKSVIKKFKVKGQNMLDMACGTGTHARILTDAGFKVTGVDINPDMLKIAKAKVKHATFVKGSMQTFKNKEKFDIVTCLFTSINYNKNLSELRKTIKIFFNLVRKGGIFIFDVGLIKGGQEKRSGVFIDTYTEKDLHIARISQWHQANENPNIHHTSFLMLIKERGKVDFEIDEHELGIFAVEDIQSIMEKTGLTVQIYDDFTFKKYSRKSPRPVFVGYK